MNRHKIISNLFSLSLVCMDSNACNARSWYVKPDRTGDAPTVRAALDSATAGDSVILRPGEYSWTTERATGESMLVMKRDVNLIGSAGAESTLVDAEYRGRVIRCHDVGTVLIRGLTIVHGNLRLAPSPHGSGGGIYSTGASRLRVDECILRNNAVHNGNRGGAIACTDLGSTIAASSVLDNFGAYDAAGGGVYMEGGNLIHCRIVGNTVSGDGAFGGGVLMNGGTVENCWIERNTARGFSGASGGGVRKAGGTVTRTTFVENSAIAYGFGGGTGGGLYASSGLTVDSCAFIENSVVSSGFPALGGAIAGSEIAAVSISHSTFLQNQANTNSGGAMAQVATLWLPGGDVVTSCIIADSEGPPCGGKIAFSCCCTYPASVAQPLCGTTVEGNFASDPLFCSADPVASRNLDISADSPCAAGRHPAGIECGAIGTGSVGCGSTSVVLHHWSDVKRIFGR